VGGILRGRSEGPVRLIAGSSCRGVSGSMRGSGA
jgi:hypothetical protein